MLDVTRPVADDLYRPGMRFLWYFWLNNVSAVRDYVPCIEEVWMVKLSSGRAGFWFRVAEGDQFLVTFRDDDARGDGSEPRGTVKVQQGWGHFDRQIDWDG